MLAFKKAREIVKGIPNTITSDKLRAYPMGIERAFVDPRQEERPQHSRVLSELEQKERGISLPKDFRTLSEKGRGFREDGRNQTCL